MSDDFSLLTETWKDALGELVRAVSSEGLSGDAQRERIRRELVDSLGQCRRIIVAQGDLCRSMQLLRDAMDDDSRALTKRKERVMRR